VLIISPVFSLLHLFLFVLLNYLNKLLREHLVDAVLEQLEVVVVVT
jgi:hypothetical protein